MRLSWDDLLSSTQCLSSFHTIVELEKWKAELQASTRIEIKKVELQNLRSWHYSKRGEIEHSSKKFFRVSGYRVHYEGDNSRCWDQPALEQNEIGILGLLCCKIKGIKHFLVQAKIEPGNINQVQLSPTLQATRSNFQQIHKGDPVRYLDYFLESNCDLERLQSEQGSRFFKKLNRNAIVYLNNQLPEESNFRWMTLGQIFYFLKQENVVNMDLRSVLANLMELDPRSTLSSSTLNWLSHQRFAHHYTVEKVPLQDLNDWQEIRGEIRRRDNKFFSIVGVSVFIEGREVTSWDQPMIQPAKSGICGLLVKYEKDELKILVQSKFEFGLHHRVELAPTVQAQIGGMALAENNRLPYIQYFSSKRNKSGLIYSVMQSEEGGRFYREENSNQIIEITTDFEKQIDGYEWISLKNLIFMISIGGYVNVQLRNLALILWLDEMSK